MQLGQFPLGYASIGEITGAGVPSTLTPVWDANSGVVFLYELTTFQRNIFGSWIVPLGVYPLGTAPDEASATGTLMAYFSDVGFITGPTDALVNISFEGVIESGLRITRSTPATPEASRRVNLDLGTFSFANGDGDYDSMVLNSSVDGRRIQVKLGLETYSYNDFFPIFTGRMMQWSNSMDAVQVTVRDEGYRLEKNIQADVYDGTGGYNGGADLTGKPRPLCFGQALNIPAVLINATNLVYQFHSRACLAVDAVYDRGAALINDGDFASYAALTGATIATGHFATCLAIGCFRLGSTPSGLVTVDARGDAVGGHASTTGAIANRIMQDFGGLLSSEVDAATINAFITAFPGTIGWWQGPEHVYIAEVLDVIFGHCAGWWGPRLDGIIQCGYLTTPSTESYSLFLEEGDILNFEILDPLAGTFPPRYRQRVGYQKLWTTQQDTDLAGSVTADRRSYLSQEMRVAYSQDLAVQNSFLLATDPPILPSLFYNLTDAQTLAANLLALYKVARQTIRVVIGLEGVGGRLGSTVMVTFPRLNRGAQTPMLLMDVTLLADRRLVELVLWG